MLDLCIFLTWFRLEQWTTRKLEAAVWNSKHIYGFVDHKHSDFRFTIRLLMYWSRVDYLWIIVMFLSTVWTIILTAPIHCRGSIGEKQTHLHLGWPDGEYIFSKVLFLGEFIIQFSFSAFIFQMNAQWRTKTDAEISTDLSSQTYQFVSHPRGLYDFRLGC